MTCIGHFLAAKHSWVGHNSAHSSKRIALGYQNQLRSRSSSWHIKSSFPPRNILSTRSMPLTVLNQLLHNMHCYAQSSPSSAKFFPQLVELQNTLTHWIINIRFKIIIYVWKVAYAQFKSFLYTPMIINEAPTFSAHQIQLTALVSGKTVTSLSLQW